MTRGTKFLLSASVCFALMFPLDSLAQKGGGGTGGSGGAASRGGGGKGGGVGVQPTPAAKLTFTGGLIAQAVTVGSDQPALVSLNAGSDGAVAPTITKLSGPAGLIVQSESPVTNQPGVNGSNAITFA